MRLATLVRTAGELLITAGVLVLLFLVYELKITDLQNASTQHRLAGDLRRQWALPAPAGTPAPGAPALPVVGLGQGLAVLRIPRLGPDYHPVIVEGVSTADLEEGPGHYPGTALPGQIGNFVVSGHRTTYGHPFTDLDRLRPGDAIVVQTRDTWFTYTVVGSSVVRPNDVAVVDPVPNAPGRAPTAALLTFTTCNPKYSASSRLIVFGQLVRSDPTAGGLPPALAG